MKSTELRIGNYVYNFNETIYQIIDGEDIDDCDKHKCFQPIPLTPEWINTAFSAIEDNYGLFYFRRDGSNKSESGMDIVLTIKNCLVNDYWVWDCCIGGFENCIHLRYIEFVHQLQNLIYILTEDEKK